MDHDAGDPRVGEGHRCSRRIRSFFDYFTWTPAFCPFKPTPKMSRWLIPIPKDDLTAAREREGWPVIDTVGSFGLGAKLFVGTGDVRCTFSANIRDSVLNAALVESAKRLGSQMPASPLGMSGK